MKRTVSVEGTAHYPRCLEPCPECDYDDDMAQFGEAPPEQPDDRPGPHPFNPDEVDIGVGIQRGDTCIDCGETEEGGLHGN